jgi:hypothetical protein
MERPRLRDNRGRDPFELYPIGQLPDDVILRISKYIVFLFSVGNKDLSGDGWGDAFAYGIDGTHLESPLGIADVVLGTQCWSTKTIKSKNPHTQQKVRVISGRCSPDYSYGINDPHDDIQRTGTAVLSIYNERINIAKDQYEPLRSVILMRNFESFDFTVFEHEVYRYVTSEYEWQKNNSGNLEGIDSRTGRHCFTWQPHGSQFTILYDIPASAKSFKIRKPPVLNFDETLEQIGFDASWVAML